MRDFSVSPFHRFSVSPFHHLRAPCSYPFQRPSPTKGDATICSSLVFSSFVGSRFFCFQRPSPITTRYLPSFSHRFTVSPFLRFTVSPCPMSHCQSSCCPVVSLSCCPSTLSLNAASNNACSCANFLTCSVSVVILTA